jgi:hypothetical protein
MEQPPLAGKIPVSSDAAPAQPDAFSFETTIERRTAPN